MYFIKMGGSLITKKDQPHTARLDVLNRLAAELMGILEHGPERKFLLGHGSGSFGHVPAKEFATRQGVRTKDQWGGFIEVWRQARELNDLVIKALHQAGLNTITFPPSATITSEGGQIVNWNLRPIESSIQAGLIPVVYGDVTFDEQLGGTILSTEDLFFYLADHLKPCRILLMGIERGVWLDYPQRSKLIHEITPENYDEISASLLGSASPDVTGGMLAKVESSLSLVNKLPGLEVHIFSGKEPGNILRVLNGEMPGTIIRGSTL